MHVLMKSQAKPYYVGSTLLLPRNGVLRLATDGTALVFSSESQGCDATATYNWTGGLVLEQRNVRLTP